jgi:hypothetical protein
VIFHAYIWDNDGGRIRTVIEAASRSEARKSAGDRIPDAKAIGILTSLEYAGTGTYEYNLEHMRLTAMEAGYRQGLR